MTFSYLSTDFINQSGQEFLGLAQKESSASQLWRLLYYRMYHCKFHLPVIVKGDSHPV